MSARDIDELIGLYANLPERDRVIVRNEARFMTRWRRLIEPSLAIALIAVVLLASAQQYEAAVIVGIVTGFALGVYTFARYTGWLK